MKILPKTKFGKLSVILIVLMFLLFLIGSSSVNLYGDTPANNTIFQDVMSRPILVMSMLIGFVSGISSFILGVLSVTKKKERSALVFVSMAIGGLLLLMLLGEIVFPH